MNPRREKIKLEPITPELINEVIERIVKAIDPDKIILFGSLAKGNRHERIKGQDDELIQCGILTEEAFT